MGIGPRLLAVANLVPEGYKIADIGTDHGYLPIHLIKEGQIEAAVAGDVNEGPLASARRSVAAAGLKDKITTRLGSGLEILQPGEVDLAIMCGMGGALMVELLKDAPEVVAQLKGLILQPQQGWDSLRRYLYEINFHIAEETLVEEDKRLYQVIYAVPGQEPVPGELELHLGPVNLRRRPELLQRLIGEEMTKVKRRLAGMEKSAAAKSSSEYAADKAYLEALEALL